LVEAQRFEDAIAFLNLKPAIIWCGGACTLALFGFCDISMG